MMLLALLLANFAPYAICLYAIGRNQHRLSFWQLVLRSALFLWALKLLAISSIAGLMARDLGVGQLLLYLFAFFLLPERQLCPLSSQALVRTGLELGMLALAFAFLWAVALVAIVLMSQRLRVGSRRLVFLACLGISIQGIQPEVAHAQRRDVLPKKTVKILPTSDIAVIGWVDATAVVLPEGANPALVTALNDPTACLSLLLSWGGGTRLLVVSDADRQYANAFLLKKSGNAPPPTFINPPAELQRGDFRLFNRLQVAYRVKGGKITAFPKFVQAAAVVGKTPNPCDRGIEPAPGETDVANGAKGITTSETGVFQVNQGRIGVGGQAVDRTLNDPGGSVGTTTPWIWSAIKFGPDGSIVFPYNHQIFPTYSLFENGVLLDVFPQSHPEAFISLTEASRISGVVP